MPDQVKNLDWRVRKAARLSPAGFWERHIGRLLTFLPEEDQPECDDANFDKRVRRFAENLQDGVGAMVMFEVLRDATTYGPMLADGDRKSTRLNSSHG